MQDRTLPWSYCKALQCHCNLSLQDPGQYAVTFFPECSRLAKPWPSPRRLVPVLPVTGRLPTASSFCFPPTARFYFIFERITFLWFGSVSAWAKHRAASSVQQHRHCESGNGNGRRVQRGCPPAVECVQTRGGDARRCPPPPPLLFPGGQGSVTFIISCRSRS